MWTPPFSGNVSPESPGLRPRGERRGTECGAGRGDDRRVVVTGRERRLPDGTRGDRGVVVGVPSAGHDVGEEDEPQRPPAPRCRGSADCGHYGAEDDDRDDVGRRRERWQR